MTVFGPAYAGAYDALYAEKDYPAECDMIEALVAEAGTIDPVRRVLDLGCGTGGHALLLAERGYSVAGIDQSADMVRQAQAKSAARGLDRSTAFAQGDVRNFAVGGAPFDAAIMMFYVSGYQTEDAEVKAVFDGVRAHLAPGAAFVVDVWWGPGVMADPPGPRERLIDLPDGRIRRRTATTVDEARHVCTVRFDLERWRGTERVAETSESHVIRFFYPDEVERFAQASGFRCTALRGFPDWRQPVGKIAWTAVAVLTAV